MGGDGGCPGRRCRTSWVCMGATMPPLLGGCLTPLVVLVMVLAFALVGVDLGGVLNISFPFSHCSLVSFSRYTLFHPASNTLAHRGNKEGPYQDRPPLCPFRLSPLLTCSGSTIAFLKILKIQGPNPKI